MTKLKFSVRLAIYSVERERDPSGCRASGLTPKLPVHVALVPPLLVPPLLVPPLLVPPLLVPPLLVPPLLVPPLLVPPLLVPPLLVPPLLVPPLLVPPLLVPSLLVPALLRLQALVPMVQRQPHRVCCFLDCPREFRLRPLWWLQKSSGFYSFRPPHCPVDTSTLVILHHRRHISADVYPTDRPLYHNEVEQDTF